MDMKDLFNVDGEWYSIDTDTMEVRLVNISKGDVINDSREAREVIAKYVNTNYEKKANYKIREE